MFIVQMRNVFILYHNHERSCSIAQKAYTVIRIIQVISILGDVISNHVFLTAELLENMVDLSNEGFIRIVLVHGKDIADTKRTRVLPDRLVGQQSVQDSIHICFDLIHMR